MEEIALWVALSQIPGVGPKRLWNLVKHFGGIRAAWTAEPEAMARVHGWNIPLAYAVAGARRAAQVEPALHKLIRMGIRVVTCLDDAYPAVLRNIYDPPPLLYLRGSLEPTDSQAVAIVGSRRASAYGRMVAESLAADLARAGVTVVSGLARGIDSAAHRGALKAGGRTLAVLGSGADVIYPPENRVLAREIEGCGAVISELPLGTPPLAGNFPARNRIISGLSLGVVVVEAGEKSGSLHTVDYALEHGKDVFAVPGSIRNPLSVGPHRLIKQGARLAEAAEDILEELGLMREAARHQNPEPALSLTREEQMLISWLSDEPVAMDDLAEATALPVPLISSALLMLELKGLCRQATGGRYVRTLRTGASGI